MPWHRPDPHFCFQGNHLRQNPVPNFDQRSYGILDDSSAGCRAGCPSKTQLTRHQSARKGLLIHDQNVGAEVLHRSRDSRPHVASQRNEEVLPEKLHTCESPYLARLLVELCQHGVGHIVVELEESGSRGQQGLGRAWVSNPRDIMPELIEMLPNGDRGIDVPSQGRHDKEKACHGLSRSKR